MNICIVGTGYVGLVTGACLADFGMDVTCVDIDADKIDRLSRGEIPIYEPGLEALVEKNSRAGRLHFSTDLPAAIRRALAIFIAVGTPPLPDGSADLSYVRRVAEQIAEHMDGYKVVVTKSTVPTGTGQMIEETIRGKNGRYEFSVVSNPEFLREGSAIEDFMRPDRVVIGARHEQAVAIMKDIYSPLHASETPFVITSIESAELIKYASNGFLATKISFINEIALLCEEMGADVQHVARGMGLDKRIGAHFLQPGPGFGGSCFPKDTSAVAGIARRYGRPFQIIEAVIEVNELVKARMFEKIRDAAGELTGKTVAMLGLSFKPETDDVRDSASLYLIERLQREGARIRAFDPAAMGAAAKLTRDVTFCENEYDVAAGADVLVLATEWNQFRKLDLPRLRTAMKTQRAALVDLRNVYDPDQAESEGFVYCGVGRSSESQRSARLRPPVHDSAKL